MTSSPMRPSTPNPALQPFGVLIGTWKTTGTHGLMPDTLLHGRTTFEWFEDGAFILMHSEMDDPRIPKATAIIGSDDTAETWFMLTFDVRGVSRKYDVALDGHVVTWWRDAPGLSQRYTLTIVDDGRTIVGKGELSKDGVTWEKDLDLTYARVG